VPRVCRLADGYSVVNHAGQIATSLDKAHASTADRRFMFWNITLTFLLSVCLPAFGP